MAFFFNRRQEIPKNKQIQDIPLSEIIPNKNQPRRKFTEQSVQELAQTIENDGLLQPIVLREVDGKYEIVAGERRFRAVKSLGRDTIPAIVQEIDDNKAASLALIENLQRENLNPIDEANAYANLMKINGLTQKQLAQSVGKSQPYVANKMRLLKLTANVQSYLVSGDITPRHGRALLNLPADKQELALKEILDDKLNVKQTEEMIQNFDEYLQKKYAKPTTKKALAKNSGDLKVQINTIKKAIKLAKDSGIQVKYKEDNSPDEYKITIELHRK